MSNFDLSSLSQWTQETKNDLIRASLLVGRTAELIDIQTGIKHSEALNIFSTSQIWQLGSCGRNASGSTTLTQKDIDVVPVKNNQDFCIEDLEAFWTSTRLKAGSYQDEMPFEQIFTEELAGQTAKFVEQLTWRGNTTSGAGNLSLVDGFLAVIDADALTVTGTTLPLTAGTVIDAVDELIEAIPEDMVDSEDNFVFMGNDSFRVYMKAVRDANLFHQPALEDQLGRFRAFHLETNVIVVGVGGLNNTGRAVLAEASNLVKGVDLENDAESFKLFFDESDELVKFTQKFKIGFQTKFGARIVVSA